MPAGAKLVILTARSPHEVRPVLRRLRASGYGVEVVALGNVPAADATLAVARSAGIPASTITFEPDWQTAHVAARS